MPKCIDCKYSGKICGILRQKKIIVRTMKQKYRYNIVFVPIARIDKMGIDCFDCRHYELIDSTYYVGCCNKLRIVFNGGADHDCKYYEPIPDQYGCQD